MQPGADGEAGLRPCLLTVRVPSHANIQHRGRESENTDGPKVLRILKTIFQGQTLKKRLQQTQPRAPTPPPGTRAPPCRKLGQSQSRTGTGHCGKQTPATRPGGRTTVTPQRLLLADWSQPTHPTDDTQAGGGTVRRPQTDHCSVSTAPTGPPACLLIHQAASWYE